MRFWRPDARFDPWKPGRNANDKPISIVSFHPTSEIPCFYHVSHNSFIWKVAMNTGTVSDPAGSFWMNGSCLRGSFWIANYVFLLLSCLELIGVLLKGGLRTWWIRVETTSSLVPFVSWKAAVLRWEVHLSAQEMHKGQNEDVHEQKGTASFFGS